MRTLYTQTQTGSPNIPGLEPCTPSIAASNSWTVPDQHACSLHLPNPPTYPSILTATHLDILVPYTLWPINLHAHPWAPVHLLIHPSILTATELKTHSWAPIYIVPSYHELKISPLGVPSPIHPSYHVHFYPKSYTPIYLDTHTLLLTRLSALVPACPLRRTPIYWANLHTHTPDTRLPGHLHARSSHPPS